jgi:hypothetical protein
MGRPHESETAPFPAPHKQRGSPAMNLKSAVDNRTKKTSIVKVDRAKSPLPFLSGLFLLSAGTLMYEVVLTRLLSVISWYYLAFVSVSMAMLGMTAGALFVQLRPHLFQRELIATRLRQFTLAMAVATPLALVTMLAIPIEVVPSIESIYSFVLFCGVIATPFVFSGIVVCLSLTRSEFAIGRVYFVDLLGAATGSVGSIVLLELLDAPSAMFAISGILFLSVWAFARFEDRRTPRLRFAIFACVMLIAAGLNSATPFGFGPIRSKGLTDKRTNLLAEVWNPISRIRAWRKPDGPPALWGFWGEKGGPQQSVSSIWLDIDNEAGTPIYKFNGSQKDIDFLAYDATTLADQLRRGGSTAIIGVGGGRDLMAASLFNFHRIVGIELNAGIYDLATRRFKSFGNLDKIHGLEIHQDEGRSYLSRTSEKFDVIQASMVDTWAATSAGAMTLSENSLYTVDAWRMFYRHLNPGGIITFTRWNNEVEKIQTSRMFALGWATLISEGVSNPGDQIALVGSGPIATILVSNQPFSGADLKELRTISSRYGFKIMSAPDQPPTDQDLKRVTATKTLDDLSHLSRGMLDFSPVYDSSPFFFNSLRLSHLRSSDLSEIIRNQRWGGNLRALLFLLTFLVATLILLVVAIMLPVTRWAEVPVRWDYSAIGGVVYFIAIGLGFMLTEMAMMQQLSLFLGHPIYSLVVVLTGLTMATGIGSLASEQLHLNSNAHGRAPAIVSAAMIVVYSLVVLPLIHSYAYLALPYRVAMSLTLVVPIGLALGFCFPVGLRWMTKLERADSLPWMWALNGAASVVAGFLAIIVSMEASITISVLVGAGLYLTAAMLLPWSLQDRTELAQSTLSDGPQPAEANL